MNEIETFLNELNFISNLQLSLKSNEIPEDVREHLIEVKNFLDILLKDDVTKKVKNCLICEFNNNGVEMVESFWDSEKINIAFGIVGLFKIKQQRSKNKNKEYDSIFEEMDEVILSQDVLAMIQKTLLKLNEGIKNNFLINICLN